MNSSLSALSSVSELLNEGVCSPPSGHLIFNSYAKWYGFSCKSQEFPLTSARRVRGPLRG